MTQEQEREQEGGAAQRSQAGQGEVAASADAQPAQPSIFDSPRDFGYGRPARRKASGRAAASGGRTVLHYGGYGLLAMAFVVAGWFGARGMLDSYHVGRVVGAILFIGVGMGFGLAWLITRNASPSAKGIAALLAGIFSVGTAFVSGGMEVDRYLAPRVAMQEMAFALEGKRQAYLLVQSPTGLPEPRAAASGASGEVALMYAMAGQLRHEAQAIVILNRKTAALDLRGTLSAPNLMSAQALAQSRSKLVLARTLLAEGLSRELAALEGEQRVFAQQVPAAEQAGFVWQAPGAPRMTQLIENTQANMRDADQAVKLGMATLDAIENVLECAQRNQKGMVMREGQLLMPDARTLAEMRGLMDKATAASKRQEETMRQLFMARDARLLEMARQYMAAARA